MRDADDSGFFVGYINKAPGDLRWFLPLVAVIIVGLFALSAILIAVTQDDPGPGKFLWGAGYQTMTGVLEAKPYPIVHVAPNKQFPKGRSLFLSGSGKRGVQSKAAPLDGQIVDIGGILLKRGDLDMLQVGGKVGLRKSEQATAGETKPASVDLGRWRLTGEICDGKCYAGAMRPGTGIAHKACANLCLIGGAPPVFSSTGPVNDQTFFLLADKDGGPLDDSILDLTALLVEVEGSVEQRGNILILRIDPETLRVL